MSKEIRKAKVLKGATDCFARYGYEKTTLEDIGKSVGLNKASLYYYYKNKEDIFCDVLFQEADIYMHELQGKIKSAKSSEAKILSYLSERLNYYRMMMNLHNLSLDTVRKVEPIFTEIYDKILKRESIYLASLIKDGIEGGEFVKVDVNRVADALLNVATSIRYRELHISFVKMAGEADYDRILEDIKFVSKLMLKGLKAT